MTTTQPTSSDAGAASPAPPPVSQGPGPSAGASSAEVERRRGGELATEHGRTSISDAVVGKIAGVATREIAGVHDMGTGASRVLGTIRERLPVGNDQPSASRGVSVEVGESQAAVDLDVVVDYGASIVDVARAIRQNVIDRVERMTGLEVTEVNVSVDDVWLGEQEEPRVQ